MKLSSLSALFLAAALVALWMLGLFELTLGNLILLAIVLVGGAFIGIGLGRRSSTANAYYDRARAEWERRETQMQAEIQQLRDKQRS